eukprot:m51a1_g12661 hypothetical protein (108) ;mRNA; f:2750-3273
MADWGTTSRKAPSAELTAKRFPVKEKPPKTRYQESYSTEHRMEWGKPMIPYNPDAYRNIKEPQDVVVRRSTVTSVLFGDQSSSFKPADHYKTTYQVTIAAKRESPRH